MTSAGHNDWSRWLNSKSLAPYTIPFSIFMGGGLRNNCTPCCIKITQPNNTHEIGQHHQKLHKRGRAILTLSCCVLSYLKHSALKHSNTQPRNIISTIQNFIIIGCIPGPMKHRTAFTTSSSPCTANVLTSLPACCSAVEVPDQGKLQQDPNRIQMHACRSECRKLKPAMNC